VIVVEENLMNGLRSFSLGILALLLIAGLPAQTKTIAERLGYAADSKLLILHADDLGVAHSEDVASFEALDKRAVSSASIMVPCPWLTEVADYAKEHPDADLGLHLTLTSEWKTYRWGAVESKDKVPSLLGPDGTFWLDSPIVAAHDDPQEAERELRAQVDRAVAMGIRPTHLDGHMAAVFSTPRLFARYVRVAHDYHLPFLAVKLFGADFSELSDQDIVVDSVVIASPEVKRERWKNFYLDAIKNMKPGLTEMIVHLGHDDAELEAIMVEHEAYGAAWRQRDFDVITGAEFQKALQDNHIVVIRWRDLQKLVN
jgi:chitin disaccharide deacetylase